MCSELLSYFSTYEYMEVLTAKLQGEFTNNDIKC